MKKPQVDCNPIFKLCIFLTLWLIANAVYAIDTAILDAGSITGKDWKLEGVALAVIDLNQKKPQFKLSATKLTLPKPFHDLSLADIRCYNFTWDHDELHCNQGRASVRSAYWQSPTTNFSFHLGPKLNTFKLEDARLAGSRLLLHAEINGENWQGKVQAKHISNSLIDKLFQSKPTKLKQAQSKQGRLNLTGTFSGKQNTLQAFNFTAEVEGLTDQSKDGKIAAEKLNLLAHLEGKKIKDDGWYWQNESKMMGGALYVDPVYLEAGIQPIALNAQGTWNAKTKKADIQSFTYQHPDVGTLTGNANGYYRDGIKIDKADITLKSNTLQGLLTTYINPFFTESPFTSVSVAGGMDAQFNFIQQTLTDTSVHFSNLNVKDEAGRVAINEGAGRINWSDNPTLTKRSELAWQQFSIKGLPLGSAKLPFISQGKSFTLAEKIKIPFLNGSIAVDKFSWQAKKQDEPDVSFTGSLDNVSLEQLSKTLGWTPLSGNISGQIPGVDYHDKTLTLDGELKINVFDGIVKVNNLASSDLFTDFPKVYGDIAIENLDLDQLTRKFEFGNITGRLSGTINKLVLENWHPVTFFAWLGTPDDDDSSHRISQKAVKNIASIGGGGATDLLSRSFLGFFETFGYDKIGVGCYLHNGVCQMMGLEAAEQGYYLIKGGGLPRIDVLGYNPSVNWDVLVERLGRVASPDKAIVQ
ncbi:C4-dicarboxylate ABC transporter [Methyloglobulus sp.]|uniref:C4-dicarboxylate ABC transporter n=1 Tax=Methyloglobulus sp. TaxID=2518622 RepID=UPI0032B863A5